MKTPIKLNTYVLVVVIVAIAVSTTIYTLMALEQTSIGTEHDITGNEERGLRKPQPTGRSSIDYTLPLSAPGRAASVSIEGVSGFEDIKLLAEIGGLPQAPDIYELVLKPSSTAYITMSYDFSITSFSPDGGKTWLTGTQNIVGGELRMTLRQYFEDFDKLKFEGGSVTRHPALKQIPGVTIYPSNITNMTDNIVSVTYTFKADMPAERGTYLLMMPSMPPGQFLTVGDKPYEPS